MTTSFYPPHHIGGDAVHVKYLAESLYRSGSDVQVMHSIDSYRLKGYHPKKSDNGEIKTHELRSPLGILEPILNYTLGTQRYTMKRFRDLIHKEKPDVVHHHNMSLLGYNLLKKINEYKCIYTAHDYWLLCMLGGLIKKDGRICSEKKCIPCALRWKKPPQLWRYLKSWNRCLADIDTVIAPSNYMKNRLSAEIDLDIEVIPNFVPDQPQITEDEVFEFDNYFLYLGVLEEHKGVRMLMDIFAEGEVESKLIVAGRGSLKDYICRFIRKNNLQKKIICVGWVDGGKKYSLLKNADALLMPSLWEENSPLVALESLSFGVPVIGSDLGGIPEIISKVDDRLIFDHRDPGNLRDILTGFREYRYDADTIKEVHKRHFSTQSYTSRYLEVIG